MRRRVTSRPVQRRGAPGLLELRRLRIGLFRLGRFVDLDTRAVFGFTEVTTGHEGRRCGANDLDVVLAHAVEISRPRVIQVRSSGTPDPTRGTRDLER